MPDGSTRVVTTIAADLARFVRETYDLDATDEQLARVEEAMRQHEAERDERLKAAAAAQDGAARTALAPKRRTRRRVLMPLVAAASAATCSQSVSALLNVLLNRAVPRGWEIPANLTAAALTLAAAAISRRRPSAPTASIAPRSVEGCGPESAVGVPLGIHGSRRRFFPFRREVLSGRAHRRRLMPAKPRTMPAADPEATAVSEELIFRTALEATFARRHSRLWAALGGAKLFGLWHILPAMDRLQSNPGVHRRASGRRRCGGGRLTTAIAGLACPSCASGAAASWRRSSCTPR